MWEARSLEFGLEIAESFCLLSNRAHSPPFSFSTPFLPSLALALAPSFNKRSFRVIRQRIRNDRAQALPDGVSDCVGTTLVRVTPKPQLLLVRRCLHARFS